MRFYLKFLFKISVNNLVLIYLIVNNTTIFTQHTSLFISQDGELFCKITSKEDLTFEIKKLIRKDLKLLHSKLNNQMNNFLDTQNIATEIVAIIITCAEGGRFKGYDCSNQNDLSKAFELLLSDHGKNTIHQSFHYRKKRILSFLAKNSDFDIFIPQWPLINVDLSMILDLSTNHERDCFLLQTNALPSINHKISQDRALMLTKCISHQYLLPLPILQQIKIKLIDLSLMETSCNFLFNLIKLLDLQEMKYRTLKAEMAKYFDSLEILSIDSVSNSELDIENFFEIGDFRGFVPAEKTLSRKLKDQTEPSRTVKPSIIQISPGHSLDDSHTEEKITESTINFPKKIGWFKKIFSWIKASLNKNSSRLSSRTYPEPKS